MNACCLVLEKVFSKVNASVPLIWLELRKEVYIKRKGKRKGKGFSGIPKQGKVDKTTGFNGQDSEVNNEAISSARTSAASIGQTTASGKSYSISASGFEDTFTKCETSVSGYRLVDLRELSTFVSEAHDCTSEGKNNLMPDFKIQSLLL